MRGRLIRSLAVAIGVLVLSPLHKQLLVPGRALGIGGLVDMNLRRRCALIAMSLMGVSLSLGRFIPRYNSILVEVRPFLAIRFPEKSLLLTTTAIVLVTALGQMGIELPAGTRRLALEHRNPVLIWGALITLLSLLGCTIPLSNRTMRHAH